MKFILSLFALVIFTESCNSQKETITNAKETTTTASKASKEMTTDKNDIIGDNYKTSVTYKAMSRGSFEFVQISKTEMLFSTDRNLQDIQTFSCEEKDWEDLMRLIKVVNKETFQTLKAPTDKRLFDGAAHATLAIREGDVEIMTPTFDHGHPPAEIEAIVNKVLSVKENAIKQ